MLESVPKGVKTIVLLLIIGVIAYAIYYEVWWYTKGQQVAREQTKANWEANQAFAFTEQLREKGRQKVDGYEIQGTHAGESDYTDVTITKSDDGKVIEETKAPRMTLVMCNAEIFRVRVFDATETKYEEAGNATTTKLGDRLLILYEVGGP